MLGRWELFNILRYEVLVIVGWRGTGKTDDDDSFDFNSSNTTRLASKYAMIFKLGHVMLLCHVRLLGT